MTRNINKNRTAFIILSLLACLSIFSCATYRLYFLPVQKKIKKAKPSTGFNIADIYRQVTTHPEMDVFPAISPDGKWLAFASKRSGNMDIWIKPTAGGAATQITKHKADDIMPAWAPDSKNLVFVSYREDAKGDLWIVPIKKRKFGVFPQGEPLQITKFLGADLYPTYSPDGKMIAFASKREGKFRLYALRLRDWKVFELAKLQGTHPSFSPDGKYICFSSFQAPKFYGQISIGEVKVRSDSIYLDDIKQLTDGLVNDAFPHWHPSKNEIFFTRFGEDTNGDGILTPEDQPELWKIIFETRKSDSQKNTFGSFPVIQVAQQHFEPDFSSLQEIKLIPALHYDYYAVPAPDSLVYFASTRAGAEDIFAVSVDGAIPRFSDPFIQFQFAKTYFPLPETDLLAEKRIEFSDEILQYRLLAFQRTMDFFPEERSRIGETYYELARTYAFLGDTIIAKSYLNELMSLFPHNKELVGKACLKLFELNFKRKHSNFTKDLQQLNEIFAEARGINSIQAKAKFFIGQLEFLHHRYSEAIQTLENLAKNFPDEKKRCAQAKLLVAEILSLFGQKDEVISSFIKVIKNFPEESEVLSRAFEKIFALVQAEDPYQFISNLRQLALEYPSFPLLKARSRYKIAEIFYQQKDFDAAARELRALLPEIKTLPDEFARTLLFAGDVYQQREKEIESIRAYKEVIEKYSEVANSSYSIEAEKRLLALYMKSAENFLRDRDFNAAYSRYRQALSISPLNIDANRGMIAALYQIGKIDEAIRFYENRLMTFPDQEKYLYLLGLCYSYKATEISDRTHQVLDLKPDLMQKSIELIELALSRDYRILQAYLTLSFNYETMERYETAKASQEKSLWQKSIYAVLAPLKTIWQTITFQKQVGQKRYYEKAIDALTAAIALNDERENPKLESELALNLASNYYNLQESGFEKAYHFYQVRLQYDSTFADKKIEAEIYQKLGHCAYAVEDVEKGPFYLKKAIKLMKNLGNETAAIISIKRLALLYQLSGENDLAIEYFKQAADFDKKYGLYNQLEADYRSIAYNFLLVNDQEEAERYAGLAMELIRSGKVKRVKAEPNWIKIGILGWEIPVYNLGQISAGQSTAAGGFTTDEEIALLYSILGNAALGKRNLDRAIKFFQQKLEIFRKEKDYLAQAIILNNLGYLNYLKLDFADSWDSFYASYQLCRKKDILPGQVLNAVNLCALAVLANKTNHVLKSADPFYDEKADRRLIRSLEIADEVLPKIKDLTYGFKRELAQIYILCGNLHFLKSAESSEFQETGELSFTIESQLSAWQNWGAADSCFKIARNICQINGLTDLLINAEQNHAEISLRLGEFGAAVDDLIDARHRALRKNDYLKVMEIDFALAKIAFNERNFQNLKLETGDFYLAEAIDYLDRSLLADMRFRPSPVHLFKIRDFFEFAISKKIESGNYHGALELVEKYRGVEFLTLIGNHRLQLKKERHKIFLGNARYLAREINELDEKIRLAYDEGNRTSQEIASWTKKKKEDEQEYKKLLSELGNEDPELKALLLSLPVSLKDVQKILQENDLLIQYFLSGDRLNIWIVQKESLRFKLKKIEPHILAQQLARWRENIDKSEDLQLTDSLTKTLVEPFAEELSDVSNLIIVRDKFLYNFPIGYFIQFGKEQKSNLKSVVVAPDLASYYFSFLNRKIKGDHFWTNDDSIYKLISNLGYNFEGNGKEKNADNIDIFRKISLADYLNLKLSLKKNRADPLSSEFVIDTSQSASFKLSDIFALDFSGSMALLLLKDEIDNPEIQFLLEKAFVYAGTPSLIIGLFNNQAEKLIEYFYDYLFDYPAAVALLRAQKMCKAEKFPAETFVTFQAVGFRGMTDSEEEKFAQERLTTKVLVGNKYYDERKWSDAVEAYEQALLMAKKQGNENAVSNLFELVIESAANGKLWDKAILYQKELVDRAKERGDVVQVVQHLKGLIYFYTQAGQFDKAVQFQEQYLQIAESYQQQNEVADSYRRLGLVYERSGDYSAAVENYSQAIQSYRYLGDSLKVAECLKNRGRVYLLYLDQYSRAIEDQQAALKIYQKYNDLINTLETMQNLGLTHERLANYQRALQLQEKAYEMAKKLNSTQWIALSRQYLANLYWKTGDFQKALQFQKEALGLFTDLGSDKFRSVALSTMGLIYMSLGNLQEAIKNEIEALTLAEKIGSLQDQATIHKNLSMMYRSQQRMDISLEHLRHAIVLDERAGALRGLSYDYRGLGSILLRIGDFDNARQNLQKALKLSLQIKDGRNYAQTLIEIGLLNKANNNFKNAIDTLMLADSEAERLFVPEISWRAKFELGKIYRQQEKTDLCERYLTEAMEVIEKMRAKIKVEEYKSGFIDDKLDVYYELMDFYWQNGDYGKSFEIAERAKSRNFADLLANKKIDFRGEVSAEDLEQKRVLEENISRLQNEIGNLRLRSDELITAEKKQLSILTMNLDSLQKHYQTFLQELNEKNPELASMISVEPRKVQYFQKILEDEVAIIEYFTTKAHLYSWVISQKSVKSTKMDIPDSVLFSKINELRQGISRQLPVDDLLQELYNVLISPMEKYLNGKRHLVIVPHGVLHYLPFSALMDDEKKSLIEKYSLSLSPSAMVFANCKEKGEPFAEGKWSPKILALGNPDVGDERLSLPFAKKEIESIELLYPEVNAFLGAEAKETTVKNLSSDANMIIFSCHGEFDAANPLFSALLLSPDEENNGRLEAHEIFSLDLNCYLITMSACETGLSKIGVGDEVIGLTRSFIYAGASSLLSSLWKVDDLATAVLIKRFFRHLREGDSSARALQKAILFVKNNINSHPLFWSGFNLTGDFR